LAGYGLPGWSRNIEFRFGQNEQKEVDPLQLGSLVCSLNSISEKLPYILFLISSGALGVVSFTSTSDLNHNAYSGSNIISASRLLSNGRPPTLRRARLDQRAMGGGQWAVDGWATSEPRKGHHDVATFWPPNQQPSHTETHEHPNHQSPPQPAGGQCKCNLNNFFSFPHK